MSTAKLPDVLPGRFFVLEYKKDSGIGPGGWLPRFILHVDDAKKSTYNLGTNLQVVMMRFKVWGLSDIGNRAIDISKEFGAVQVIPSSNRTIPLYDRKPLKHKLDFRSEDTSYAQLPSF